MAAIRILSKRIFVMNDPHYCSIALRMRIVHRWKYLQEQGVTEEQTCQNDFHTWTTGAVGGGIRAATVYGRTWATIFGAYATIDWGAGE